MPLFTLKCKGCEKQQEKFVKSGDIEFKCECGCSEYDRVFNFGSSSSVWKDAKDHFENVLKPEVDRLQEKIASGSDSAFLDVAGE